jgi:hypothetical protein
VRSGSVSFEVDDLASAVRLTRRLASQWRVTIHAHGEASVVTARLHPDPADVAQLLRVAEAWVENDGSESIRFEVDDREYVLRPR